MFRIEPVLKCVTWCKLRKIWTLCRGPLWCSWWAYPPVTRATRVQLPVGELPFLFFVFLQFTLPKELCWCSVFSVLLFWQQPSSSTNILSLWHLGGGNWEIGGAEEMKKRGEGRERDGFNIKRSHWWKSGKQYHRAWRQGFLLLTRDSASGYTQSTDLWCCRF